MTHPLDDEFDIGEEARLDDFITIDIPDDPTLDTIIDLALRAYKEQMEDVVHIEPKNRARYLEVAEKFLDQAKDAMAKKEQIKLAREKAILAVKQKPVQQTQQPTEQAASKEDVPAKSRQEMYETMRLVKQ